MTEDEAFIRAVVDNPGDDTPRLVYADWLDDHADPRGPYLRVECEWGKVWRSGERPADSPELREMTRGLDPVWVARVSRPPLGVCCEHVRYDETGPRLATGDMAEIKRWRRVRLPDDYTAFLLNYNGGIPTVAGYHIPQIGPTTVAVSRFYTFYPNGNLWDPGTLHREVNQYWNNRLPELLESKPSDWDDDVVAWYHNFIPVADVGDNRVLLVLGVYGENRGRLQLISWDWGPGSFVDEVSDQLGGSFAGLLSRIGPPVVA